MKTVAEESSVTAAERATPETDAVWAEKSRNILEHARNLERQRDEARKRTAPKTLDELEALNLRSIVSDQDEDNARITAALDAEQAARKALVAALLICIRYADSSADTEQAFAALALAAKLP